LTPLAIASGCVGKERRQWFEQRSDEREAWRSALAREVSAAELAQAGLAVRRDAGRRSLAEWLRFDLPLSGLARWFDTGFDISSEAAVEIAEDSAYAPYLERQEAELRDMRASAAVALGHLAYGAVPGLSREMVERLDAARPATLADASRLRGITPAALAAILVHARRRAEAA
jgi:tRNA uridine 5-carboxymethylaminomethyl modification enzyme